jgi:hypothetical protein
MNKYFIIVQHYNFATIEFSVIMGDYLKSCFPGIYFRDIRFQDKLFTQK